MSKVYWLSSPETSDLFERLVLRTFGFLYLDYNFQPVKSIKDCYGCRVILCNPTTGIGINYEPGPGNSRIWILLYRLISGQIPEYLLTPLPGHRIDYLYLQQVMALKDSQIMNTPLYADIGRIDGSKLITEEYLQGKLQVLSECVRTYANDILAGDFSIFDKAKWTQGPKGPPNLGLK